MSTSAPILDMAWTAMIPFNARLTWPLDVVPSADVCAESLRTFDIRKSAQVLRSVYYMAAQLSRSSTLNGNVHSVSRC